MPIHLKVEPELDRSAAQAAANDIQNTFRNVTRNIGTEFSQGLKSGVDDAVRGISGSLGGMSSSAESAFGGINSKALLAAGAVGGIALAAVGVGTELYNLGSQWDSITDRITGKTGIVGTELDKITESVKNVGVNSSASLAEIGDVAGNLVQALQLSGKPLEDLTTRITDLNELTGDKLNVRDLAKVFKGFGVEADGAAPALNRLYDTFTNTGIPVSELIASLKQVGPTARTMGLDIGATAGLLVTFNEAGINSTDAFTSLKIAMGNLAKKEPGKDPQQAIRDVVTEIQNLINKGDETAGIDMAKTTFGRSWQSIFDAIKNGKLNVDDLNKSVENTGHTIEGSKKATDDWAEEFKKMKNSLVVELEPAARVVFSSISNMITQYLINPFHQLNDLISGAGSLWKGLFGTPDTNYNPGGGPTPPGVPFSPTAPITGAGSVPSGQNPLFPPGISGSPTSTGGSNPLTGPLGLGHPGPPQLGGGGGAAPASFGGGNEAIVHQAMVSAGWGEDQWPALRNLMMHESGFSNIAANPSGAYGMFQFMPYTWGTYGTGGRTSDPSLQAQYGMQYIAGRYGSPSAAWAQYFNHAGGEGSYAAGGGVDGPGGSDNVPAWLTAGEFVVNKDAAAKHGPLLNAMNNGFQHGGPVPLDPNWAAPGDPGYIDPSTVGQNPLYTGGTPHGLFDFHPGAEGGWKPGQMMPSSPFWQPGSSGYGKNPMVFGKGYQTGGPVIDPMAPAPAPAPAPDMGQQAAQAFFGGLQQGGGLGGIIGGFGNMALNAAQQGQQESSVQPGQQPSGKGGGSSQSGAGGALGMVAGMFPGGQVASALAMRTAKFGGQLMSIGIMGGMETFLPGGTDLSDPSKSLVGRIASGIAGGQPASKNMAAQAKPPPQAPPPPMGSPASGRGSGPAPGPAPMVVMNQPVFQNGTDGEAVARDIARQQRSYTAGDNSR